ncbi:MAG TPA: SDR family oxidoreductase [Mycobacteriales bacterium]|nr:SDR family oxidoreductase [Mycobacteriales bacterium]
MTLIPPAFNLEGRVAIVTGASAGLGERFARVLHASGAQVVAVARRADKLQHLADELPGLRTVTADVTDAAARQRLVDTVVDDLGRVDVLVNNAGGAVARPALEETAESFVDALGLNLVAPFALAQLVARPMLAAGRGSIINIASVLGTISAWPVASTTYTAAKGGLVQLTRELACQWAAGGVRVNAIAPGFFRSEAMDDAATDALAGYIRRGTPMGRMGDVHELDGALVFLASDASSYVTGQVLAVDGGWTAH